MTLNKIKMFQDVIKNQQSIVNETIAIKAQITKNQSKDSKKCLKRIHSLIMVGVFLTENKTVMSFLILLSSGIS
jgi:hypothetical protein